MSGRVVQPGSQPTPVRAPRSTVVRDPGRLSSFWRAPRGRRGTWLRRLAWLGVVLGLVLAGGLRGRTDLARQGEFAREYTNGALRHQWHDAVARPAPGGGWEVLVRGTCTNVTDEPWGQAYGGAEIWAGGSVVAPVDVVPGRLDPDLGPSTFQPGVATACTLHFRHSAQFRPEDHYAFQERALALQQVDLFGQEPPSWQPAPSGVVTVFFPPLVVEG